MKQNKVIAIMLVIMLVITSITMPTSVYAKSKKIKLDQSIVFVLIGKKEKVTLKNANKKVKWTVANKKVAKIVKKKGKNSNTIIIKGLKKGTTKITAKCGKKKYTLKVRVKKTFLEKMPQIVPEPTAEIETTTKVQQEQTTEEPTTVEEPTETVNEVPTEISAGKLMAEVLNDGLTATGSTE